MMPPHNESVKKLSEELGISDASLYTWRKEARQTGHVSPGMFGKLGEWRGYRGGLKMKELLLELEK